jgi:hypothetical protein
MDEWMDRLVNEWMDDQQLMMMMMMMIMMIRLMMIMMMRLMMIMMMRLMMIIISIYKYPLGTEQCSTLRHLPSASKSNSCILFKKTK